MRASTDSGLQEFELLQDDYAKFLESFQSSRGGKGVKKPSAALESMLQTNEKISVLPSGAFLYFRRDTTATVQTVLPKDEGRLCSRVLTADQSKLLQILHALSRASLFW